MLVILFQDVESYGVYVVVLNILAFQVSVEHIVAVQDSLKMYTLSGKSNEGPEYTGLTNLRRGRCSSSKDFNCCH